MFGDPVTLAQELIRRPSVTPRDEGCQEILISRLEDLGFTVYRLKFGVVENFYARLGGVGRHFCFAGHTDVVPSGDAKRWTAAPFGGEIRDGVLFGRGVADMKGGVAAMTAAVERFLAERPTFKNEGSLSFLITGDEEAEAVDGTVKVLEWMERRGERIDCCLVGEPTSSERVGDVVKVGRRGSLNGEIVVQGIQGHVAHPHRARNPIHQALPVLAEAAALAFDQGDAFFPASCLQFTNLHAGEGVNNVIPGELRARFNVRHGPASSAADMIAQLRALLDRAGLEYTLESQVSGDPFLTPGGFLLEAVQEAVRDVTALTPESSTSGGTSDARFIAKICPQTVELGLLGQTIHQVDERCPVADLHRLTEMYLRVLHRLYPTAP
ncbi:MAG: succinyl-diaminopimelate desuccinylase [Magnetococcales bacterium]|nr:succinyl-diaminopimelate desuccinylase [Magnetococcales bacterium]